VVVAQVLVVTPIAISLLTGVFSMVPREMEESAVVYGAGWREVLTMVILPLSTPGLISAWGISFFRALGEFGATLILAGNIPGYTETLPLALYNAISLADVERASVIYTVILVVGLSAVVMHALVQRSMIKSPAILRV
ncbi:MAG: ABC transporter permease subunit, partial [Desulfurococcales archaeon]|nr:ABC transporter permease subunit [Desulfurococcales archaeon]